MPAVDSVLKKAVDLAREAALETADDDTAVGEHLGVHHEGERLATHLFACSLPGYRGWVWSVTVSRAPRGKEARVCEAHMVPADDALLAPSWVPWSERVRPGDLEPSMTLPKINEDPRLVPGFEATGDEDLDALAIWELGLGRERVLGPTGKDEVVQRWYRGSHGPTAASAIASTSPCATCAFFWPLGGSMRQAFGACTNEWSPSDGKVVSIDHGCGAHSQTDVEHQVSQWPAEDPVIDTDSHAPLELDSPEDEAPAGGEAVDGASADNSSTDDGQADDAKADDAKSEDAESQDAQSVDAAAAESASQEPSAD